MHVPNLPLFHRAAGRKCISPVHMNGNGKNSICSGDAILLCNSSRGWLNLVLRSVAEEGGGSGKLVNHPFRVSCKNC